MSERDLLGLLDAGERLSGPERALLLAGGADAGSEPLGERDRAILGLHAALFGPDIEARHTCPACAETITVELAVGALEEIAPPAPGPVRVHAGGYVVTCRLLTGGDLTAAAGTDPDGARRAMVDAVVLEACTGDRVVAPDELPADVVSAVVDALAEADPLAEIRIDLVCPACAATAESVLDPAQFVWSELTDRSRRVLWEVHVLAGAYGWTEDDVLALPPSRRAAYLAMVLGD